MKLFTFRQIREAQKYAADGGQALHLWKGHGHWLSPYGGVRDRCFRRSRLWAHLFDQDVERLVATARRLGVHVINVSRRAGPGQHIDLCGKPLLRAMAEAQAEGARMNSE